MKETFSWMNMVDKSKREKKRNFSKCQINLPTRTVQF